MYPVKIAKVENGFIAKAGCKTLVFETYKTLEKELREYLKDPDKYMKKKGYPTDPECVTTPPECVTTPGITSTAGTQTFDTPSYTPRL